MTYGKQLPEVTSEVETLRWMTKLRCSAVVVSLLVLSASAETPTNADEPSGDSGEAPGPAPTTDRVVELRTNKAHFVGLRGDFGSRTELGIGYLHAHEREIRHHLGGFVWFGYGADARVVVGGDGLDAVLGYAVARVSGVSHGGPLGLELALGAGSGGAGLQGAGSAGIYLSGYYFELGYAFQFPMGPFDRPDWLGGHFLSIRAHVPIYRYDQRSWTEKGAVRR
jgi:hypothetical protein